MTFSHSFISISSDHCHDAAVHLTHGVTKFIYIRLIVAGEEYRLSKRAAATRKVSFADLFEAGLVQMDDALVSVSPLHPGRATVTSTGKIMLANGEMFEDPTEAYGRFLTSVGASADGQSGWMYWRRGDGGPLLDDLRAELA